MSAPGLTYRGAGVDIDLKQRLVPLFRGLAKIAPRTGVRGGIGGFGALLDLPHSETSPVLVAGTDGVGTKLKIAVQMDRHDTVGIDCVAMCVNDILCAGARPWFFLDYIGIGKLRAGVALALVKGIARGCAQAGAALVGGETAQLPGLYPPGEYDLVGFAVGLAERTRIPDPKRLRAGDVLVGLQASGLHSNGYSLARQALLERGRLKLGRTVAELGCTLGEELLRPTRIYAKEVLALFADFKLKAIANITGGGVPENLPRVLPGNLRARLRRGSWPLPPIFELIQRCGQIGQIEMERTFNLGLGMIGIFDPTDVDAALAYLRRRRLPAYVVGELSRGRRAATLA
jgi:phosphoribosylformylglycinamidine cyclo-ligase